MTNDAIDSSSTIEKLGLLALISAIVIENICVLITYFVRTHGKHWSNVFVLSMVFIDLFIGSFVLPMRYVSVYGSPLSSKLCAALSIGESCAIASSIYLILLMIYSHLLNVKQIIPNINYCSVLLILFISWITFFLFYAIPFMINFSSYFSTKITFNLTSYCVSYIASIYHPSWMSYIEFLVIYSLPFLAIFIGLCFLLHYQCQLPRRQIYLREKRTTRHIVTLSFVFVLLWLPWIVLRILFIFHSTKQIQHALHITYYILILKSVCFPILYASTNQSFRCTFAIYRKRRITTNNVIWPTNDQFRH